MKHTTLNKIRACSPCSTGWNKLLKHLGKTKADDEMLPFEVILDSNGLDDALWCMRSAPEYDREWRLFAVWCARQVQLNLDPRVAAAIDAAEDYANGRIDKTKLAAARAAARDAAGDAAGDAARAAARDAAWAAAGDAAWAAARAAAGDAARAAAGDAAWAAARAAAGDAAGAAAWAAARAAARAAAWDAAWAAAWDAAWDAAMDAQSDVFRWIVNGGLTKFESEFESEESC